MIDRLIDWLMGAVVGRAGPPRGDHDPSPATLEHGVGHRSHRQLRGRRDRAAAASRPRAGRGPPGGTSRSPGAGRHPQLGPAGPGRGGRDGVGGGRSTPGALPGRLLVGHGRAVRRCPAARGVASAAADNVTPARRDHHRPATGARGLFT